MLEELGEMQFEDRVALAMIELEMSYERNDNKLTVPDLEKAAQNYCISGDESDRARVFVRLKDIIEAMNTAHEDG